MRALALLSGGMDSAIALWWARSQGLELLTLSFLFHGRPAQEALAARRLSQAAGVVRHHEIQLPFLQIHEGPLQGYLPKRNLIFYSTAAALAEVERVEALIGGHLSTDSLDFPDASPAYFERVEQLINVMPNVPRVKILLPLIGMTKEGALLLGKQLECPLELSWSCFRDGPAPCGVCAACQERIESFAAVGLTDRRQS
jgi:7-cyano-7-deazaguanine synthase